MTSHCKPTTLLHAAYTSITLLYFAYFIGRVDVIVNLKQSNIL